jgi:hypothetical protein
VGYGSPVPCRQVNRAGRGGKRWRDVAGDLGVQLAESRLYRQAAQAENLHPAPQRVPEHARRPAPPSLRPAPKRLVLVAGIDQQQSGYVMAVAYREAARDDPADRVAHQHVGWSDSGAG